MADVQRGERSASAQAKASQHGADMITHRVRADIEVLPDFLVGEPVLEQVQNFRFARAEFHAASRWLYFDIAR